jgi:phage regulator Rha-like protein
MSEKGLVPVEQIHRVILVVRGHKVLLDTDLAAIYGVAVKALNQAVKRNRARFPEDFVFRLSAEEAESLRSQIVTLDARGRGQHRKYPPYVFTEHGALMAASVLNSPRAIQMSLYVVRAFVGLREWVAGRAQLAAKLADLEQRVAGHDQELKAVVQAIRQLMTPPEVSRRKIGFRGGDPR